VNWGIVDIAFGLICLMSARGRAYYILFSVCIQFQATTTIALTSVTAPLQRKEESVSLQQNSNDCCLIKKKLIQ